MIGSEVLIIRKLLVEVTLKIGQEKYLLLILFWKLILGLIREKIMGSFQEKQLFLCKL